MPEYYDDLTETAVFPSIVNSTPAKNKKIPPTYFRSGRYIVYGDTGIQTNHMVGTADEDLYFKVKFASGATGNEGATLFYDNPRDYCVHYLTKLNKKKYYKNENYSIMRDRVDMMMNEISYIVEEWKMRRDEYLQKHSDKTTQNTEPNYNCENTVIVK